MVLLFHVSGLFALFQALMGYVKGADIYRAPSMLVRPGLPLVLCVVGARGNEETRIMSSWRSANLDRERNFCGLFRERLHLCKLALARMSTPSLSTQTHA